MKRQLHKMRSVPFKTRPRGLRILHCSCHLDCGSMENYWGQLTNMQWPIEHTLEGPYIRL